jgi:hypothetical protein
VKHKKEAFGPLFPFTNERIEMSKWKEANESFDLINNKLDLILELVNAKKVGDWKHVDEVCKKLDAIKKVSVVG